MNAIDVAVLGATGLVGQTILSILEERDFPVGKLYPLASERSAGKTLVFKNKSYYVEDVATFDFSKVQLGLFSAGGSVSATYAPKAVEKGCVVIDNTSFFRYHDDVPLVVPEVNANDIALYEKSRIIANPNCSTIQMLTALKPIYSEVGIKRIDVATYQSVSGTGKSAVKELISQSGDVLNGRPANCKVYPVQIAFNVIPQIDVFQDNGYTKEEMKMLWETQKMLHDKNIQVNATCVRVPVIFGHSEAIHIETERYISAAEVKALLQNAPGVCVVDDAEERRYPTAVTEGSGDDLVYVGRIRNDITRENGLNLWVVSDNIRKGAACNAVQIAEILVREYL